MDRDTGSRASGGGLVMNAKTYHSKINNITSSENALIILQGLHVIPGDLMITLVICSYVYYQLSLGSSASWMSDCAPKQAGGIL